jgi:hypothetical protein
MPAVSRGTQAYLSEVSESLTSLNLQHTTNIRSLEVLAPTLSHDSTSPSVFQVLSTHEPLFYPDYDIHDSIDFLRFAVERIDGDPRFLLDDSGKYPLYGYTFPCQGEIATLFIYDPSTVTACRGGPLEPGYDCENPILVTTPTNLQLTVPVGWVQFYSRLEDEYDSDGQLVNPDCRLLKVSLKSVEIPPEIVQCYPV